MYAASLNGDDGGERFYLRILLHHVKGPTSFEDVRTVEGRVCPTFKQVRLPTAAPRSVPLLARARRSRVVQACFERGLLQDDRHWDQAISDVAVWATAPHLRRFFAMLLCMCEVADAKALWEKHRESLAAWPYPTQGPPSTVRSPGARTPANHEAYLA